MTNIEYFNKIHNKGSIGKRIWQAFDDTLNLPLNIYLLELEKYLKRTKEYKKSEDKEQFLKDNLDYMQDYYETMQRSIKRIKN